MSIEWCKLSTATMSLDDPTSSIQVGIYKFAKDQGTGLQESASRCLITTEMI